MNKIGNTQPRKRLPEKQFQLLFRLVNSPKKQSNKIFDKQDNCFQVHSYRGLAELSGESKSSIGRLFGALKADNLVKKVIDIMGNEVLMLAPYFSCRGGKFEKLFMHAMFQMGSNDLACEWSKHCRKDYVIYDCNVFNTMELVDFKTGEITYPNMVVMRRLSYFEVKQWNSYRNSYSANDRTKSRVQSAT
jgi:hypothetical protein